MYYTIYILRKFRLFLKYNISSLFYEIKSRKDFTIKKKQDFNNYFAECLSIFVQPILRCSYIKYLRRPMMLNNLCTTICSCLI